jgi:Cu(I)/Ag(I) efflux system membrane protein CusA/SilA
MIAKIIEWSIRNRFLVLLGTFFIISAGYVSVRTIPLDAIPDLSDVQVIVYTKYPGQSPQVVEDQVTYPVSTTLLAVPFAETVRGYSFFGISFVYVIFKDGTDLYWARSRVLEQMNLIAQKLPDGTTPALGPDATGVGWIYQYGLIDRSGRHDLAELRSIQDWYLRFELQTVPGVAEVASVGGFVKQYQVEVDPNELLSRGIPITKIRDAIKNSNRDTGGRLLEMAEMEFMVRGRGYIRGIRDIEDIVLGVSDTGTPVYLRDVATVRLGPELRRGVTDFNGEGDIAAGIVIMRFGENALETIKKVKAKLKELERGLPEGVEIVTLYDRSPLIERAIEFLSEKLFEEIVVVSLVCIVFLMHVRSALVAIIMLPVGILAAFIVMKWQGINANIMSLGGIAIAIGAMIDGAIVMIENAHKHLERDAGKKPRLEIVIDSAKEVGPALFFSLLIITISFFPVFSLQAQEGRLFSPLAFTKTYSMAAAAILSITLVPVLIFLFVKGEIVPEAKNPISAFLIKHYKTLVTGVFRWKLSVLAGVVLVLAVSYYPANKIGSEFMPPLNEGDILYMPSTLPGVSIAKIKEILQQTDRILMSFPEVVSVFGKAGRAETATDPAPLSMVETTVVLKPMSQWREGMTMKRLMAEMDRAIQFPGLTNAWTMPIKTRIDMLATGIKTPVGIKIAGDDIVVLQEVGREIEAIMREIPGTLSAFAERSAGGNYLDFDIDRRAAARYGIGVGDIQMVISTAIGGMNVTETVEGRERYPVNLRYSRELRGDIDSLKRVLVPTPSGDKVPLAQVANISITKGPPVIKSENARLNSYIYVDLDNIDVGSYVVKAKKILAEKLKLPPGVSLSWSGQYEYMERAKKRLMMVVPVTLVIIFLLLFFNFGNITESLLVMLSIPFALVGSVWLLWALGYNYSVAVVVGMIALAGVASEIGVLVLLYIGNEVERRKPKNRSELAEAVVSGAIERVRPIIMTAAAVIGGLLPIMWGSGTGSEVMRRIATPMVGGMVTTVVISLLVLPLVYVLVKGRGMAKG